MADQSLSAVYTANRKTADDAELERWLAEPAPPAVLGPPTPEPGAPEKKAEKPGAAKAIGVVCFLIGIAFIGLCLMGLLAGM